MKLSFLYGADLPTMMRLLRQHQFRIGLRHLPLLGTHLLVACANSVLGLPNRWRSYEEDPIRPVFILGHWRGGTTHLHNLLTLDGAYRGPSTFDIAFPHAMIHAERWLSPLLDQIGPGKRPQDNMAMWMASVNEEEMALACLGAPTPYLAIHFPRASERYQSYLSFANAREHDRRQWQQAHRAFVRMLVAKYGRQHPLMLKSPANTARIPLLLEMYPDARFVHIHRDPYEVIQSSLHLYEVWFRMVHFQSLDKLRPQKEEKVLQAYEEMYQCWERDKALIPADRLMEIRFDRLKEDPLQTVEDIYHFLGDAKPHTAQLERYLQSIAAYQQNAYEPLSPTLRDTITHRLAFAFEALGYPIQGLAPE